MGATAALAINAELEQQAEPEPQDETTDPVRAYLMEIRKVDLLSGADEQRLARQIEEGQHIREIGERWLDDRGQRPTGSEILSSLLEQLQQEQRVVRAITEHLKIKKGPLSKLVVNETFRHALDGEVDQALIDHLTRSLRCDPEQAGGFLNADGGAPPFHERRQAVCDLLILEGDLAALVHVREDRDPQLRPDPGQDPESVRQARAAVGAMRAAVRLVEGGLQDQRDAGRPADVQQPLAHMQEVRFILDDAGPRDEGQGIPGPHAHRTNPHFTGQGNLRRFRMSDFEWRMFRPPNPTSDIRVPFGCPKSIQADARRSRPAVSW